MTDLRRWTIFAGLDQADLDEVLSICRVRRYRVNDHLILEDEVPDVVYLIDDGHCLIERVTLDGSLAAVATRGPGEVVGESALVVKDGRRGATVRAVTALTALRLRAADFDELRTRRPSVDRVLVAMLADRNRQLSSQLVEQRFAPVPVRVKRELARLSLAFGDTIPLPQHAVASLVGTTRTTLNAALRDLEEEGLIELKRSRIIVRDPTIVDVLDERI